MPDFPDGSSQWQRWGRFVNRYDAGRALALRIREEIESGNLSLEGRGIVVGLPRGGLEVAFAIANELKLPIDFRAVKKVGHPAQPEFAIGAVDISGVAMKNPYVQPYEMPQDEEFDRMVEHALEQARIMDKNLRGNRVSSLINADWCFVVDDGAATGLTLLAAVKGIKSEGVKVIVAVPVSSDQAKKLLSEAADGFIALMVPDWFGAVGQFYDDFSQVPLEDVRKYL
ncbi:MAG: phosphoribosyltransferase family protein [bacterium]|nr:phosphoribosyltransferase family protein [bacterium]